MRGAASRQQTYGTMMLSARRQMNMPICGFLDSESPAVYPESMKNKGMWKLKINMRTGLDVLSPTLYSMWPVTMSRIAMPFRMSIHSIR